LSPGANQVFQGLTEALPIFSRNRTS
jgi:hypothetical protein